MTVCYANDCMLCRGSLCSALLCYGYAMLAIDSIPALPDWSCSCTAAWKRDNNRQKNDMTRRGVFCIFFLERAKRSSSHQITLSGRRRRAREEYTEREEKDEQVLHARASRLPHLLFVADGAHREPSAIYRWDGRVFLFGCFFFLGADLDSACGDSW